jgi:phosphate uptake regulator
MSEISKAIVSWANRTDMETITVGMLKDWVLEMELDEQIEKQVFQAENCNLSDIEVLKLVYCDIKDVELKQVLSKIIIKMEYNNIENI